jgi:PKD repeat protein
MPMIKIFRVILCILLFYCANVDLLNAQNTVSYNDTFVVDVSYGSGQSQWDNWSAFRASLDTTKHSFLRVTMKGTFDKVGRTCNDPKLVKQIAFLLKNNSNSSVTCDGIVWKAGTVGKGVEFSSDGTLNKCSKKGYSIRPQMGSSRWGGINTNTCGAVSQRMQVIFEKISKPQDAGISAINASVCSPKISVTVSNFGNTPIDSLKIGWSVNNQLQKPLSYSRKISALSSVSMDLLPNYSFKDGETYFIKTWTCHPYKKDSVPSNDTSIISIQYIAPPGLPQTSDMTTCGINKIWLKAIANNIGDSLNWYDSELGGKNIGTGKNILSPNLKVGINSFYVESSFQLKSGNKCVSPERGHLFVTVNPRPSGASISKVNTFHSSITETSGISTNPDVVSTNDKLLFEVYPPYGYKNSDYKTKWQIDTLLLITKSGKSLSNEYYTLLTPKNNENAFIVFNADSLLVDSMLQLNLKVSNIGQNTCDSNLIRYIYVAPMPKPFFSFSSKICETDTISFVNDSKISKGHLVYKWNFNTGNAADTSNLTHPIFKFPTSGIYHVELTAISVPYNISSSIVIPVLVNENPKTDFKVRNACIGDSLSFYNTSLINNSTLSYTWNFGDGIVCNEVNPRHIYKTNGNYKVSLTATSASGCELEVTKNANQFDRPIANFNITGSYCSQSKLSFINTTTINKGNTFGSYWELEDTKRTNENNPSYIYSTSGLKTIKYIATSQFGCTDSMVKTISIEATPIASFESGPVCNFKPTIFKNTTVEPIGIETRYLWNFESNSFSERKNPEYVFPKLGKSIVELKAIGSNGCSSVIEKSIDVLPRPIANFEANNACAGEEVIFTNKTKGTGTIKYQWFFGDGETCFDFLPTKLYDTNTGKKYTVKLIAKSSNHCEDEMTKIVEVIDKPKCKFSVVGSKANPLEFNFIPEDLTQTLYQWRFEGGGNSNLFSPRHIFPGIGKYRVTVMMRNSEGCDCIDSTNFVIINTLANKDINWISGVSVYPNPNNGSFSIITTGEEINFIIFDLNGKALFTEHLIGKTNYHLKYDQLAAGSYLIRFVKSNGQSITKKLNIFK